MNIKEITKLLNENKENEEALINLAYQAKKEIQENIKLVNLINKTLTEKELAHNKNMPKIKKVNTLHSLNIRNYPNISGYKYFSLPYGTTVEVLEENHGWSKIFIDLWCCSKYLDDISMPKNINVDWRKK